MTTEHRAPDQGWEAQLQMSLSSDLCPFAPAQSEPLSLPSPGDGPKVQTRTPGTLGQLFGDKGKGHLQTLLFKGT